MCLSEYLKWRGDLTFQQDPFNLVDNVLLSQMAYTFFDSYILKDRAYTIQELSSLYFSHHTEKECQESRSFIGLAPLILKGMGETERFQNALVHDFVFSLDEETHQQFACFSVDLSDGTTYIAFRGTDDTLTGWQEDLCLSYETVPAQLRAEEYVLSHIHRWRKYRIGGHSKGGNLAIYSVLNMKNRRKNILNIYSNDGPGIDLRNLTEQQIANFHYFEDRIVKLIPEFDVFGMLFSHTRHTLVIRANASALMQHSAMSWMVEGNTFLKGTLSEESRQFREKMNTFLSTVSKEECKNFCDEVFDELRHAGIENITDFSEGGLPVILKALLRLSKMSNANKKIARELLYLLVYSSTAEIALKTTDRLRQNASDLISSAKQFLQNENT